MTCPFMLAAIRHEAETYLSQGLHQEALAVYERFLKNAGKIDPELRETIEAAKDRISSIVMIHNQDEVTKISDIEITFIKKGWRRNASANDLAVSAKALMDLGRYGHALEEYRHLLIKGRRTATAVKGIATCLLQLTGSEHFADAVAVFARGALKKSKNQIRLKLLIAKSIDAHQYPRHFTALYRHLKHIHPVSEEIRLKIRELNQVASEIDPLDPSDDAYGPIASLDGLYRDVNARPQGPND